MFFLFFFCDFVITVSASVVYTKRNTRKHLFSLIETFMAGAGLKPKQIVVWFGILVGQSVMFLCVYHAHHQR